MAPELDPVIVSPVSNLWLEDIKSLGTAFPKSSTNIVAVALEVSPVIVSPSVNLPVVPTPVSATTLVPSSLTI